jgi:hypothetical protein
MNRPPAFQFYPKDWLDFRVQRMSLAAQGAYLKLLCFMWADSADQYSIIDNNELLARAIGTTVEQWLQLRKEIQCESDPILGEKNGYLVSLRLKHEATKQRRYRQLQREKGKRSAQSRLNRGSTAVQPEYQPEGNSSSSSSNKNKKEERAPVVDLFSVSEVLDLWNQIPGAKLVHLDRLTPNRGLHKRITTLTMEHKHHPREWWTQLFAAVEAQKLFLFSGQNDRGWIADLAWVLCPENLAKVQERRYEDFKAPRSNGHAGRWDSQRIPV